MFRSGRDGNEIGEEGMAKSKKAANASFGGTLTEAESKTPAAVTGSGNPGVSNLDDALAGLVGTAAPKSGSKDKDPNINIEMKGSKGALVVDIYIQALSDLKDAEARIDTCGGLLLPEIEKQRVALSQLHKKYHNSLDVNGKLKYIVQHRYKSVPADSKASVQAVFGEDYDKYFSTGVEIKVKASTFDELTATQKVDLVNGIKKLCTELKINPFEIKPTLLPSEALTEKRVMDPVVAGQFKELKDAGIVEPIKATLKAK